MEEVNEPESSCGLVGGASNGPEQMGQRGFPQKTDEAHEERKPQSSQGQGTHCRPGVERRLLGGLAEVSGDETSKPPGKDSIPRYLRRRRKESCWRGRKIHRWGGD